MTTTRSIAPMPCSAIAAACSGSSRTREQAAMDLGVERLHPPVHHLGKAGEIGDVAHRRAPPRAAPWRCRRSRPARRRAAPAPGPARRARSCPRRTAGRGRSSRPSWSFLRMRQRLRQDARLSSQRDGHALGRRLAGDDELERRVRPRLAVDPEAVLDRRAGRRGSGTARPRRRAARSSAPWPSAVRGHLDRRARGGSGPRRAPARARRRRPAGDQPVLAAEHRGRRRTG